MGSLLLLLNKLFSCFFQIQNYPQTRTKGKKPPTKEIEYRPLPEPLKLGGILPLTLSLTSYFGFTGKHEMIELVRKRFEPRVRSWFELVRKRSGSSLEWGLDGFPASRMRVLSVSVMGETHNTSRNDCRETCTGCRNCGDSCWFCRLEKKPSVSFRLWVSLCPLPLLVAFYEKKRAMLCLCFT